MQHCTPRGPQSAAIVQLPHVNEAGSQTFAPPEQSPFLQQLPVWQRPAQHFAPLPHCTSVVQTPQLPFAQTCPDVVQSAFAQQLPWMHCPVQHLLPGPQSRSCEHAAHIPPRQTAPPWQSLSAQQLPG